MAISIGGTVVIDDGRNIINVNDIKVGLVTITSSGNITTPGTITAAAINFSPTAILFSPADGATGITEFTNIVITFDQLVAKSTTGIGTTANITLRNSSGIGTVIHTIGISSAGITISGPVVTIDPPGFSLPASTDIYVVVDAAAFKSSVGDRVSARIDTYNFTSRSAPALGDSYEGGFVICKASPLRWVISPRSAEVSRNWYSRDDANTRAQQVSGCTGWFVPTCGQLQNPGFCCRSFWGPSPCSSPSSGYWSSSECAAAYGCQLRFTDGLTYGNFKTSLLCVRAFRCVTY
jgi:hypothetical protein